MNDYSVLSLRKKLEYHKSIIKELEKELDDQMAFNNSYETLIRANITESGSLTPIMVSKKLNRISLSTKNSIAKFDVFVSRKGRTITCTLSSTIDGKIKGVGKATCRIDDKFNYDKGVQLAEIRARKDLYANIEKQLEERL